MLYSSLTNIQKLNRAEVRFRVAITQLITKRKPRRPSASKYEGNPEEIRHILKPIHTTKNCALCQDKRDQRTHMVETKETGLLMLEPSSKLTDKSFYICLNTITSSHDATAYDVRYHLPCWSAVK